MRNRSNRAGRTNSFGCSSFSFSKGSVNLNNLLRAVWLSVLATPGSLKSVSDVNRKFRCSCGDGFVPAMIESFRFNVRHGADVREVDVDPLLALAFLS